jgi:transposase
MAANPKSAQISEGTGWSLKEVSGGARRASAETSLKLLPRPEAEVVAVARRRRFSGAEKRRLLAEADQCKAPGELGAFLRRERLYSSMLASWRKQAGAALGPQRRGPKPNASARQIQLLHRDNLRLRQKLERAELIIEAQKKLCSALGLPIAEETSEHN